MCRKYANTSNQDDMRHVYGVDADLDFLGNAAPKHAIWPKHEAPIVRLNGDGRRELVNMHWGFLTPQLSKKTGKPIKPAAWQNARDDKVRRIALWRESFDQRRCLLPATAFHETRGKNPATDFWFALKGDEELPPFAFAGLWREGQPGVDSEEGAWLTHTMITTTPNELVKPVHPDRMPVILDREDYETWLHGEPAQAAELLRPYPAEKMRIVGQGVGVELKELLQ